MNQFSVHTVISLSGSFIRVFPILREIITESRSYDDPAKYIAFRSASVRSNWFAENYLSKKKARGLKNAISEAKDPASKEIAALEVNMIRDTTTAKGISGNKNFQRLERLLPDVSSMRFQP